MIPIDPQQTVEIVLTSDRQRTGGAGFGRVFLAHPLTVRQSLTADGLIAEHGAPGTPRARRNQIATDLLALALAGWRCVSAPDGSALPFDPGNVVPSVLALDDVLGPPQKMELLNRALTLDEGPDDAEKKESPSGSPSPAAAA